MRGARLEWSRKLCSSMRTQKGRVHPAPRPRRPGQLGSCSSGTTSTVSKDRRKELHPRIESLRLQPPVPYPCWSCSAALSAGGTWRAPLVSRKWIVQGRGDAAFLRAKLLKARLYAGHELAQTPILAETVVGGAAAVLVFEEDQFLALQPRLGSVLVRGQS